MIDFIPAGQESGSGIGGFQDFVPAPVPTMQVIMPEEVVAVDPEVVIPELEDAPIVPSLSDAPKKKVK